MYNTIAIKGDDVGLLHSVLSLDPGKMRPYLCFRELCISQTHVFILKTKQTHRRRDQICGYQRQVVEEGKIGWRWSEDTNFQL